MDDDVLRVFIAVDFPESAAKDQILQFQRELAQVGADLKLVEPKNIHITIRFIGETARSLVENIKTELSKIKFKPFRLTFKGVGVFPDYKRINVVWIGIEEGHVGLLDLYSKVNHSLEKYGIMPDRRGLVPHLTVARVRSARNIEALSKIVRRLMDKEFGGFEVKSFSLKQSTLTPQGPIYKTLHEVVALSENTISDHV
jgi:2'-5' RNA ligase